MFMSENYGFVARSLPLGVLTVCSVAFPATMLGKLLSILHNLGSRAYSPVDFIEFFGTDSPFVSNFSVFLLAALPLSSYEEGLRLFFFNL